MSHSWSGPGAPSWVGLVLALLAPAIVGGRPEAPPSDPSTLFAGSGHHLAAGEARDRSLPGLEFGRHPWDGASLSFATEAGRLRLRHALQAAVMAGEGRIAVDLAFDLRSVVATGPGGVPQLDAEALPSTMAFLEELDRAAPLAADVILFDHRVADLVSWEDGLPVGEDEGWVLDAARRGALFDALGPLLACLGAHPRVALNLMNEPEFLILRGQPWRGPLRRAFGPVTPRVSDEVLDFLVELARAVRRHAPQAPLLVGWADGRSALVNTLRLERRAGGPVTDVISFHVYETRANPHHPLDVTRADFEAAGLRDRPVRITEWGLGSPLPPRAVENALLRAQLAGLDGVLFWWDHENDLDRTGFASARLQLGPGFALP